MTHIDANALIDSIKLHFPEEAIGISDALDSLNLALDGLLDSANRLIAESHKNKEFDEVVEILEVSKSIAQIQKKINEYSTLINVETEIEEEKLEEETDEMDEQKTILDCPEYKEHYIFTIRSFLKPKGMGYNYLLASTIAERKSGRRFSLSDHVKGLVYSLLTNQTKWIRIEPHLKEIDKLFFYYDVDKIKTTTPDYFYNGLFDLKCGNISTRLQMETLNENITIFEKIEKDYGSIDTFVGHAPASDIVQKLSKAGSIYKLRMIGEALAWEYLRNMGIDAAKPERHLRRFLSADRMGTGTEIPATVNDVNEQINSLAEETGLMKSEIDNLIWEFCAEGYGEICTADPRCEECPIREYCKY